MLFKELTGRLGNGRIRERRPLTSNLFSQSVSLLHRLIETSSFSGEENSAAQLVEQYIAGYGIKVKRKDNNVWCYNKFYDALKPTILLNSHLDTVQPNEGYTRDPFCAEVANGRLYGLGSNDAGGCLVALVATFLHYYNYQGLGFNLCFAATAEEENSGEKGIKSIVPLLGKLDLAIVGEPTLLQMAIAEKGNIVIDCIYTGRSGHAAREEGDNAIYKCINDLNWFRTYQFSQVVEGLTPVKMAITVIKAGIQHNIVPSKCEFTVDIRHDSSYTHQQILETIKMNTSAQVIVHPGPVCASSISPEHAIVKTGIAIGCKTYISPTSSDQAWLHIPSVKIGPGDSARSHSPDEYIFIEEIKKGIDLYTKLLDMLPFVLINNPEISESKCDKSSAAME